MLSRVLDRKVTVHGPVQIRLSLQPILELGGIKIANPDDWSEKNTFLTVTKAQAQIDLIPLINGAIHITDLEFDGVDLRLVTRADKTNNYNFATTSPDMPDKEETVHELTGLDSVSLRNIRLSYHDELSGREYMFTIDEAYGQGKPKSPLHFSLQGKISEQDCTLNITGGSLYDLLYGDQPWPLAQGKLKIAETLLGVSGSLVRAQGGMPEYFELSLSGPNLDGIGSLFDVSFPETGDFAVRGQLSILPGVFQFTNLHLNALNSSLQGNLVFFLHGKRPTLAGTLLSPHIDQTVLSVFSGDELENNVTEPRAEKQNSLLPWDTLKFIDTDLHLKIDEVIFDSFSARNIKVVVSLIDGDLISPFSFDAMDVPINGRVDILSSNSTPLIEFTADVGNVELGPLIETLSGSKKYRGNLGSLALNVSSRGRTLEELKNEFEMDLQVGATTFLAANELSISSKELSLKKRAGNVFRLVGKGDALGIPFLLQAQAGNSDGGLNSTHVPIKIKLQACDTELAMDAVKTPEGIDVLKFSAQGENFCGFLTPAAAFMGKETDFSVKAAGNFNQDGWSVDFQTVRLGTLIVDGSLKQKMDNSGKSPITANLHSSTLDLGAYLQKSEKNDHSSGQNSAPSVKKEKDDGKESTPEEGIAQTNELLNKILPKKHLLPMDVTLDLNIEKLYLKHGTVADIKIHATVEDGKLSNAPFQAFLIGKPFTGNVKVDLTGNEPLVSFGLATDGLNVPDLYEEFGLTHAPDVSAEYLSCKITLKGKTLLDMEKKSTQEIIIKNGTWVLAREREGPWNISVEKASIFNAPGSPTIFKASGDIDSESFKFDIQGNGLFGDEALKPITLLVNAEIADTKFHIDGKMIRKKNKKNVLNLNTSMSGEKLDKINRILGVDLPPLGPYSVDASLFVKEGIFTFHDLVLKVGDSTLKGEMVLSGSNRSSKDKSKDKIENIFPISFDTTLHAERIQLNDFQFGEWSPVEEEEKIDVSENIKEEKGQNEGSLHGLLSSEMVSKFKGAFSFQVDEVLSGEDKLGSGHLEAILKSGQYSMEKLRLNIPGGIVSIQGSFKPEVDKSTAHLAMQIENLDYGVLARRKDPDSDIKGKMNLDFNIHSEAETVLQLKEHMEGRFRFGVIPEEYEAGSIDLWAVNLVTAVLPALLKGTPSKVNCLAGKFVLDDGIMRPDAFLLDTSKMRVHGEGEINFKTDGIDFHLNPTPKAAHFFSLATPITVSGTITDYDIGVSAGAVLGTVFQVTTSVLTVPFQWLFTDNLETDGKTACAEAMDWDDSVVQ